MMKSILKARNKNWNFHANLSEEERFILQSAEEITGLNYTDSIKQALKHYSLFLTNNPNHTFLVSPTLKEKKASKKDNPLPSGDTAPVKVKEKELK